MTAHDDLREAVARAIYESRNGPGCKPWARLPTAHKVPYLIDADAALAAVRAALREPSAEMVVAPTKRVGTALYERGEETMYHGVWRSMLAASPLADPGARDDGEGVG